MVVLLSPDDSEPELLQFAQRQPSGTIRPSIGTGGELIARSRELEMYCDRSVDTCRSYLLDCSITLQRTKWMSPRLTSA